MDLLDRFLITETLLLQHISNIRVPPIYEKFSDQVPNWAKVVPWQMGQNEPLIN